MSEPLCLPPPQSSSQYLAVELKWTFSSLHDFGLGGDSGEFTQRPSPWFPKLQTKCLRLRQPEMTTGTRGISKTTSVRSGRSIEVLPGSTGFSDTLWLGDPSPPRRGHGRGLSRCGQETGRQCPSLAAISRSLPSSDIHLLHLLGPSGLA